MRIKVAEVEFMVEEVIEGMFERTRQQLTREVDGQQAWSGIDVLVTSHVAMSSAKSIRYHTDHRRWFKFPHMMTLNRVFLHPR